MGGVNLRTGTVHKTCFYLLRRLLAYQERPVYNYGEHMVKIIDVSVFGAMGDWKSDVEKTHKKIWHLFQLTNYFLFLKLSKSVHGARRTVCPKPLGEEGGSPSHSYQILI